MEMQIETKNIEDVIGKTFLRKKHYLGEKDKETLYLVQECNCEEFSGVKFLLLFFSYGECPPCEQFMQILKDFYHEVNIDSKVIEIIYVSMDRNEAEFKESYAKMPWLTFKYDEKGSDMHHKLKERYDVKGVPMVYVMEPNDGFLISMKGRKDICDLSVQCLKNWTEEIEEQRVK